MTSSYHANRHGDYDGKWFRGLCDSGSCGYTLMKKRRYAKSAMSLVGRDIRSGLFITLKAATLIVIEDEIENELSAQDCL